MQAWKNLIPQLLVHLLGSLQFALFVFFDHRINNVGLMPRTDLLADKVPNFGRALVGKGTGVVAPWMSSSTERRLTRPLPSRSNRPMRRRCGRRVGCSGGASCTSVAVLIRVPSVRSGALIVLTPACSSQSRDHDFSSRPEASSSGARKSASSVLPYSWRLK